MNKLNKLIQLSIRHAEISLEIKINKDSMNKELSLCTGIYDENKMESEYDTCLTAAYSYVKESRDSIRSGEAYLSGSCDFNEELALFGCRHCNATRKLKQHIGVLNQERGRIHSAITNIGKSIMHLKGEV